MPRVTEIMRYIFAFASTRNEIVAATRDADNTVLIALPKIGSR